MPYDIKSKIVYIPVQRKRLKIPSNVLLGQNKTQNNFVSIFLQEGLQSMLEQINISELVHILASLIGFQILSCLI